MHHAAAQDAQRPGKAAMLASLVCGLLLAGGGAPAQGQEGGLRPVTDVIVEDFPNDAGRSLIVKWTLSPDDQGANAPTKGKAPVQRQQVWREAVEHGKGDSQEEPQFVQVADLEAGVSTFTDPKCKPSGTYRYRVVVTTAGQQSAVSEPSKPERPIVQWFDTRRFWFGVILLIIGGATMYFIEVARRGGTLKLRKIAGLEAVEEAVGRATELGRSCLFVPGIQDINDIQTVAGLTVLGHVAKTAARYDAKVEVPTSRALVMTAARETVQAAYLSAGRPDAYQEDLIYYITDEQFGYVAAVTGKMVREKPAACFLMGSFFAESLILAETGNAIGAIQLAGTAQPSQLPFFVAACDYTLIGEELFAASAYLSGEPQQLGSLKGQDVGKLVGAALIIVVSMLATVAAFKEVAPNEAMVRISQSVAFVRDYVLGQKGIRP